MAKCVTLKSHSFSLSHIPYQHLVNTIIINVKVFPFTLLSLKDPGRAHITSVRTNQNFLY